MLLRLSFFVATYLCVLAAASVVQAQYCATRLHKLIDNNAQVNNIQQNTDGSLMLTLYSNGAVYFQDERLVKHHSPEMMKTGLIENISRDAGGNIWYSGERGICYITPTQEVCNINTYSTHTEFCVFFNSATQKMMRYNWSFKDRTLEEFDWALQKFVAADTLPPFFDSSGDYFISNFNKKILLFTSDNIKHFFMLSQEKWQEINLPEAQIHITKGDTATRLILEGSTAIWVADWLSGKFVFRKMIDYEQLGFDAKQIATHLTFSNGTYNMVVRKEKHNILYSFDADFCSYETYPFIYKNMFLSAIVRDTISNTFWIGVFEGLLRLYPTMLYFDSEREPMITQVYQMQQDRYNRIWMGSYRNGLLYYDGKNLQQGKLQWQGIRFLHGNVQDEAGNIYWLAENRSGILQFDGENMRSLGIKGPSKEEWIIGFYLYEDHRRRMLFGSSSFGLGIIHNWSARHTTDSLAVQWVGNKEGVTLGNVLTISEDSQGRYWLGRTSTGIALYDPLYQKGYTWALQKDERGYGAVCSVADCEGYIWLGTNRGLMRLKPPAHFPDSTYILRDSLEAIAHHILGNSLVTSLAMWQEKYLVIGNTEGYYLMDIAAFYESGGQDVTIHRLSDYGSPLKSSEQNAVFIDRSHRIWCSGKDGVLCVDMNELKLNTEIPTLHIDSIYVYSNSSIYAEAELTEKTPWFNASCHDIRVHLRPYISSFNMHNVYYRYRLAASAPWSALSENPVVELQHLSSGLHQIDFQAVQNGITCNAQTLSVRIMPWSLDYRLWLLLSVLFSVSGYAYYWYKRQTMEAIELVRQVQNDLSVFLLHPHLLFGALNTLSYSLYKWKDENAKKDTNNIVNVLIRNTNILFRVLRTKQILHTFEQEIELLKNYITLVSYQYDNAIKWELPQETELNKVANFKVPLMLLQIHCENAVEHGIRNNEKSIGTGTVTIEIDEKYLYIEVHITDNGVGRQVKKGIIDTKRNGVATQILKQIQDVVNTGRAKPKLETQIYQDNVFTDSEGRRYGTKVTCIIPKNL